MNKAINLLFAITLLTFSFGFRSEDRIKFYWGDREIEYKSGVSLKEINLLNNTSQLRYEIREDLVKEIQTRSTKIEINLVRSGTSIYAYWYDDILSSDTVKMQGIYSSLRVGDTILIQFKGVAGIIPQIIGIKIKE